MLFRSGYIVHLATPRLHRLPRPPTHYYYCRPRLHLSTYTLLLYLGYLSYLVHLGYICYFVHLATSLATSATSVKNTQLLATSATSTSQHLPRLHPPRLSQGQPQQLHATWRDSPKSEKRAAEVRPTFLLTNTRSPLYIYVYIYNMYIMYVYIYIYICTNVSYFHAFV